MLFVSMAVSAVVFVVCLYLIFCKRAADANASRDRLIEAVKDGAGIIGRIEYKDPPTVSSIAGVRLLDSRAPRKKDCQREGQFMRERGLWYCFCRDHSACGEKKRVAANRCYKFWLSDCRKGV